MCFNHLIEMLVCVGWETKSTTAGTVRRVADFGQYDDALML